MWLFGKKSSKKSLIDEKDKVVATMTYEEAKKIHLARMKEVIFAKHGGTAQDIYEAVTESYNLWEQIEEKYGLNHVNDYYTIGVTGKVYLRQEKKEV